MDYGSPIESNLSFQENQKKSFRSTRIKNDIEYSNLKEGSSQKKSQRNEENIFPALDSSSYAVPMINKEISTLRYITDKEYDPYSLVNINPGIPSTRVDDYSSLSMAPFRDSSRIIPNRIYMGYMGFGTNRGEIDVDTKLTQSKITNNNKNIKLTVNDLTDYTFQIFNSEELKQVAPYGPNGSQDYTRGGNISRYD